MSERKFPSIDEVARDLVQINKMSLEPEDADEGIDVRLQVRPGHGWELHYGSADYDQDHRGFWGASSVPGNNRRFKSRDVARNLIEQAKDEYAMSEHIGRRIKRLLAGYRTKSELGK